VITTATPFFPTISAVRIQLAKTQLIVSIVRLAASFPIRKARDFIREFYGISQRSQTASGSPTIFREATSVAKVPRRPWMACLRRELVLNQFEVQPVKKQEPTRITIHPLKTVFIQSKTVVTTV